MQGWRAAARWPFLERVFPSCRWWGSRRHPRATRGLVQPGFGPAGRFGERIASRDGDGTAKCVCRLRCRIRPWRGARCRLQLLSLIGITLMGCRNDAPNRPERAFLRKAGITSLSMVVWLMRNKRYVCQFCVTLPPSPPAGEQGWYD